MSDLLAIGEALVELNQPKEGAPFVQGFGGDTSNAMIAAARLGADAAYFTAVGADRFGQALTELWLNEGVDASRIAVNGAAHTGLYFVTHGAQGHEFSYMRAGSAASRISESDLPEDRIRAARILHVSGISQAISSSAADAVIRRHRHRPRRQAARLIGPKLQAEAVAAAARAGDHSRGDAVMRHRAPGPRRRQALTGRSDPDSIVDFYLSLGAPVVVLKLGKDGAIAATPKRREHVAGYSVAAVDATGAGDCFDGAFLAEYVQRGEPFAARGSPMSLRRSRPWATARSRRAPPRRRRGGGCGCGRGAVAARLSKSTPNFQNAAKPAYASAKFIQIKALDFLFRIEPFQGVMLTLGRKILSPLPSSPLAPVYWTNTKARSATTSVIRITQNRV